MKVIESATDSIYLEHDGWRYQLEAKDWRLMDMFTRSSYLNAIRVAVLDRGDFTEFETPLYKLIKIGPVA